MHKILANCLLLIPFFPGLANGQLPDRQPPDDAPNPLAADLLRDCGVQGGLVVHLGCGDGQVTAELAANERLRVHGLDADSANVARAREHVRSLGRYGTVSVDRFDGTHLPYAENLVNLLVAEDLGAVSMAEVMRVLVPRGVACLKTDGRWTKTVKPWPAEIDEWSHWLHAADGNAVAQDTVAGPPRRLQWIAGPIWSRHHNTVPSVSAVVSAGGRLFAIVDDAPVSMDGSAPDRWSLVARDAFNGLLLWKKPMPDWGWKTWSAQWTCRFTVPTNLPRRLVAVGDRVYVTLAFNAPLTELDAATGRVRRVLPGTEFTDEILYHQGRLILALNQAPQRPGIAAADRRGETDEKPVKKWVAAVEAETGRMLWKTGDYVGLQSKTGSMDRINHLSMCAGDGAVYFVDRDRIVSLDLKTGRQRWQIPRPVVPENKMRYDIRITDMCSLVVQAGTLYFAQLDPDRHIDWREIRGKLHAFSVEDGRELWNHACASWGWGHPADVFVLDGLVWVHGYQGGPRKGRECRPNSAADLATGNAWVGSESTWILGLDPTTGEVKRKVSNFEAFNNGHHHRCYRNKATTRFMMTSFRGLEFIPWDGGQTQLNHWARGTCRLGAIPCNGLVYATPHPCNCYITSKLNGFVALAGEGREARDEGRGARDEGRLEKGPAFSQIINLKSEIINPQDWPMYRHDPQRSGTTPSPLPAELRKVWETDLGTRPSACVVVGETVFVAAVDEHQVLALDAAGGKTIWTFTAGGRVDTPPTICDGRAYFGSADGYVYCLRCTDGQLVWRFRGAPTDRLVGAAGGIESAWPVHGSVLVREGTVYFTAGRSSFLDGGIFAFALDALTGKVLSTRRIATPYTLEVDKGRDGSVESGVLADLLVAAGESITMRQHRVFPTDGKAEDDGRRLRSTAGLLDDSWFSRTRWYLDGKPWAEYCVFDAETVYGVAARAGMSTDGAFFTPGAAGYELFAAELSSSKKRWSLRVPVRVTSMVLAGGTLLAAGTPDAIDPTDAWAAYDGRRGGRLWALSSEDGKVLSQYDLAAPPVLDGLAVCDGRLFISTIDGKVLCYGRKDR